jgi:hypothetical protein
MELKDITLSNVKAFLIGNARYLQFKVLHNIGENLEEQFLYRATICGKSCLIENGGECKDCGCDLPERWMVDKDKQKCPFPKLMSKENWEKYKTVINLDIEKVKIDAKEILEKRI